VPLGQSEPAFAFAGAPRRALCFPAMWALLKEFLQFLRQEKKWWLVPLVLILVALAALLVFGSSSGIAWAIYPFM
jgi:predicted lysophospholipase L1 biosynthesis ABC-type transport system permease subunit